MTASSHLVRLVAAGVIAVASAGAAIAQPANSLASAQAEQLFNDGKRLMGEGRVAEACTAFEGSYRKDPAITTLLNLADCREKNHQLASAWGSFIDAERATRNDPAQAALNRTARDRAAGLEPRLSYLVINVPDDSRVDGMSITRDGATVDPAEWNRKIPIDGGTYKLEAKAPALEPWSTTVTVGAEHDQQSVDVPRFKALPAAATGGGDDDDRVDARATSRWTGKRKAAVGLGVVAVGAGVGAVLLELSARSTYDDSKAEPDDARQHDLYDQANQRRLYAQLAGGAAVAALAGGVVLWIAGKPTDDRAAAIRPILGRDHLGVALAGHF
ncbi:MAG TPA: hypothetical protein VHE35_24220 [Kofleriaceae bacterium]|nr:hypothetical protein [Kofleriaceae bacterium]